MIPREIVGVLGIAVMLLLMAFRMPIAISMALPGFLGTFYLMGSKPALAALGTIPFNHAYSFTLTTIPMFVLMGEFVYFSGLSKDLFNVFHKWLGQLSGGLALATIGACALFAAVCGSSVASAATMGKVALPEMKRNGYNLKLAAGTIAAGGTLGILIPPSTAFIIYGLLTEESIGKLFISGIIPGVLLALLFMVTIYIRARLNPAIAPAAENAGWNEKFKATKGVLPVLILFVLVIGGLYAGVFSPTEAAGVGAFGAFVMGLLRRELTRQGLTQSLKDTLKITCMIFAIIIGAMVFNYFLAITRLPIVMAELTTSISLPPLGVLIIILLIYAVLGCFMDALAMIIITIPIFLPIIQAVGYNTIWFGVILVIMIEMALITPPVGMNCYVLSGVTEDVKLEEIFAGIFPFIPAMVLTIILLIIFPQIALFLPNTMR